MEYSACRRKGPGSGSSELCRFRADRTPVPQDFIQEAPHAVVCCANLRIASHYGERGRSLYCLQDVAESIENLTHTKIGMDRTVQNTLAEMSRSGVVQMRSGNRDKWYALNSGVLDLLLKPEGIPTPWVNWAPLFRALEMLWIEVIDPKRQNLDSLTLASEWRRIGKEMRPLLADAGWGRQLEDDSSFRGVEYSAVFTRNIKGILSQLNQ